MNLEYSKDYSVEISNAPRRYWDIYRRCRVCRRRAIEIDRRDKMAHGESRAGNLTRGLGRRNEPGTEGTKFTSAPFVGRQTGLTHITVTGSTIQRGD